MTTSAARIERLSPQQVAERLSAASIAYLPLGSLEFHGPHLPIGLDALTAHEICLRAAEMGGGVVFPPYYQAVGGEHGDYPWTMMSSSPAAIQLLLTETLTRLEDFGVRRAVILSGHFAGEQRTLVDEIADRWNDRETRMRVRAATIAEAPDMGIEPDHAGVFESLLLYAIAPELVNIGALPALETSPAPEGEDSYGQDRHSAHHPLHGVFGADPRALDVAYAGPLFEHLATWTASLGAQ